LYFLFKPTNMVFQLGGATFLQRKIPVFHWKLTIIIVLKSSGSITPLMQLKHISGHWVLEKFDVIETMSRNKYNTIQAIPHHHWPNEFHFLPGIPSKMIGRLLQGFHLMHSIRNLVGRRVAGKSCIFHMEV